MHHYNQPAFRLLALLRRKVDAHTVDAVPLILRVSKPLALEDVSQMPAAIVAYNLGPHHAQTGVRLLSDRVGERIPKRRPSTPGVELVVCLVERRVAAGALVHASIRVVLVELAGAGHLSALLAENAELLWNFISIRPNTSVVPLETALYVPGES